MKFLIGFVIGTYCGRAIIKTAIGSIDHLAANFNWDPKPLGKL